MIRTYHYPHTAVKNTRSTNDTKCWRRCATIFCLYTAGNIKCLPVLETFSSISIVNIHISYDTSYIPKINEVIGPSKGISKKSIFFTFKAFYF